MSDEREKRALMSGAEKRFRVSRSEDDVEVEYQVHRDFDTEEERAQWLKHNRNDAHRLSTVSVRKVHGVEWAKKQIQSGMYVTNEFGVVYRLFEGNLEMRDDERREWRAWSWNAPDILSTAWRLARVSEVRS